MKSSLTSPGSSLARLGSILASLGSILASQGSSPASPGSSLTRLGSSLVSPRRSYSVLTAILKTLRMMKSKILLESYIMKVVMWMKKTM